MRRQGSNTRLPIARVLHTHTHTPTAVPHTTKGDAGVIRGSEAAGEGGWYWLPAAARPVLAAGTTAKGRNASYGQRGRGSVWLALLRSMTASGSTHTFAAVVSSLMDSTTRT